MNLTKRQKDILNAIVKEYIERAFPISSQLLDREYDFGVSPATLRAEMKKLTEKGFLFKPHISAGRIPTDKGYRFFVDELLKEILEKENERLIREIKNEIKKLKDTFEFIKNLTSFLASFSSTLTFTYLKMNEILWKEGWTNLFQMPEFKNIEILEKFLKDIQILEKNINDFCSFFDEEIEIFIGRENPLRGFRDFTLLGSEVSLPFEKKCYFILLGPKRMNYFKNIMLLKTLKEVLEKI